MNEFIDTCTVAELLDFASSQYAFTSLDEVALETALRRLAEMARRGEDA